MKRHDITEMRSYYDQWLSSGLGKKAFAHQAGLSVSTFYYWVSKFEKYPIPRVIIYTVSLVTCVMGFIPWQAWCEMS